MVDRVKVPSQPVHDARAQRAYPVTGLCEESGISRETGYKHLARVPAGAQADLAAGLHFVATNFSSASGSVSVQMKPQSRQP